MMKQKSFWVVVMLLFSMMGHGQLLWEVSGKDLTSPSYIFGTHHAIPVSFLDSIPDLYKYYNRCSAVVGEVVLTEDDFSKRFQKAAQMTNRLDKLLTAEEFAFVDSVCQDVLKLPLRMLNNYRPSVVSNMIDLALYDRLFPKKEEDGQMDSFFQHLAEQQNHPVMGLESVEDQLDLLFRSQSLQREAFLLVGIAKSADEVMTMYTQVNDLYRRGDLEGLLEMYQNDTTPYRPTVGEQFLFIEQRNRNWASTLPEMMRKQSCFIAVGAMHLPGDVGLIQLLKKEGYKVKAVK